MYLQIYIWGGEWWGCGKGVNYKNMMSEERVKTLIKLLSERVNKLRAIYPSFCQIMGLIQGFFSV
uniref:Uncharacterized protein n=1 Tax=Meloidogyne incognita TaxID=6306 RepID=A0A914L6I9_MELIC